MDYEKKLKETLKKVVLYQYGLIDKYTLEKNLHGFFKLSEEIICNALRRNGLTCYKELKEQEIEEGLGFADKEFVNEITNIMTMKTEGYLYLKNLMEISKEIYEIIHADVKHDIKDDILLFDKIVHAVHYGGESVFGIDVEKIKEEVDEELKNMLFSMKCKNCDKKKCDKHLKFLKLMLETERELEKREKK